jgi:AcrR family transcriptional regulator
MAYHHRDLEAALIDAAVDLLDKGGVEALSIRALARAVGVSHAAPKHHFPDRHSLAAAIARRGFERLEKRLQRAAARTPGNAGSLLVELGTEYVRYALESPALYRAMYAADLSERLDSASKDELLANAHFRYLSQRKAAVFSLFVDVVISGQRAGEFRDGRPDQLARAVTSLAHGLAHEFLDEHLGSRINRARHAREVFTVLLHGLLRR